MADEHVADEVQLGLLVLPRRPAQTTLSVAMANARHAVLALVLVLPRAVLAILAP